MAKGHMPYSVYGQSRPTRHSKETKMTRETIARLIRALLAKTTDRGCTEGEAMAASAKARDLMDRYQIDLGSVGLEEEGVDTKGQTSVRVRSLKIGDYLSLAVATYCDCLTWRSGAAKEIKFFGLRSDVEFAGWLLDALSNYVKRASQSYVSGRTTDPRYRWSLQKEFVMGAIVRILERLKEAADARKVQQQGASDSWALGVVKGALVTREFGKLGLKLRAHTSRGVGVGNGNAFQAGRAAGDGASFGRPVGGGVVLRIAR